MNPNARARVRSPTASHTSRKLDVRNDDDAFAEHCAPCTFVSHRTQIMCVLFACVLMIILQPRKLALPPHGCVDFATTTTTTTTTKMTPVHSECIECAEAPRLRARIANVAEYAVYYIDLGWYVHPLAVKTEPRLLVLRQSSFLHCNQSIPEYNALHQRSLRYSFF